MPIVEKAPDARVVLVVGDFMASGLAEGLDTAFAENPGVRIVARSNGSSGFVRDDFYNWPEQIKSLIETEKPAAVVVMLGSNDRQQMRIGDVREQPRSENWTKEYERRDAMRSARPSPTTKVPFLWVGMPAFRVPKMTSDMLAFNDIYRSAAESHGGEFVDVWDGFVDENGAFVTSRARHQRPAGAPALPTTASTCSKAGKRKLAFYAEKPLMKILGLPRREAWSRPPRRLALPSKRRRRPPRPSSSTAPRRCCSTIRHSTAAPNFSAQRRRQRRIRICPAKNW